MKKQLYRDLELFVDHHINKSKTFHEEGDLADLDIVASNKACEIYLRNYISWMPDIMPYCVDSYEAAIDAIYSDKPNEFFHLLNDIHRQAVACEKRLDSYDKWDFGELEFSVLDTLVRIGFDGDFDEQLRGAIYDYISDSVRERVHEVWADMFGKPDEYVRYA